MLEAKCRARYLKAVALRETQWFGIAFTCFNLIRAHPGNSAESFGKSVGGDGERVEQRQHRSMLFEFSRQPSNRHRPYREALMLLEMGPELQSILSPAESCFCSVSESSLRGSCLGERADRPWSSAA